MRQAFTLACAWMAALNARAPLLAMGPLLPLVIHDLALSFTIAGLLSGLPLLLMGAMGLPGGWLTDRCRRPRRHDLVPGWHHASGYRARIRA